MDKRIEVMPFEPTWQFFKLFGFWPMELPSVRSHSRYKSVCFVKPVLAVGADQLMRRNFCYRSEFEYDRVVAQMLFVHQTSVFECSDLLPENSYHGTGRLFNGRISNIRHEGAQALNFFRQRILSAHPSLKGL
jgi:hypothetical protein